MKKKWDKEDEEDIVDAITDMREMSRMAEPIDLAIVKTQTEAPQIAMRSALAQIGRLLDGAQNFCQIHTQLAKERIEEEKKTLREEINRLNEKIEELGKLQITEKEKLKKIQSEITHNLQLNIKELQNSANNSVEKKLTKIFHDTKELGEKNTQIKRIFSGLETEQVAADRKRIQQEVKEITDEIGKDKDILIFSNQEENDKFYNLTKD